MPEIGQEVVIIRRAYGKTNRIFGYRVKRITPSGQIVIERNGDERRFCKAGNSIPRASACRPNSWIDYNVAEQRRLYGAQSSRLNALEALTQMASDRLSTDYSTDRIQEIIDRARGLLDEAQRYINDARKYEEETQ